MLADQQRVQTYAHMAWQECNVAMRQRARLYGALIPFAECIQQTRQHMASTDCCRHSQSCNGSPCALGHCSGGGKGSIANACICGSCTTVSVRPMHVRSVLGTSAYPCHPAVTACTACSKSQQLRSLLVLTVLMGPRQHGRATREMARHQAQHRCATYGWQGGAHPGLLPFPFLFGSPKTSSLGADCHWLATTQPSNPFMPARGSRARRLSHDSSEPKMSPGSDVAVGALTGSPRLCWNGGAYPGVLADLLSVTRHWGGAGRSGLCWQGQCWSNTMLHTATAPVWVQPGELGHTGKQDKNRPRTDARHTLLGSSSPQAVIAHLYCQHTLAAVLGRKRFVFSHSRALCSCCPLRCCDAVVAACPAVRMFPAAVSAAHCARAGGMHEQGWLRARVQEDKSGQLLCL